MIQIRYDSHGNVEGLPDAIRPGDDLTFEIIGKDVVVTDADTLRLALAFESPSALFAGDWTLTFGANSAEPIPVKDINSYTVGIALNRLASTTSAGGVNVSGSGASLVVDFNDVGVRNPITVSHSILGPITGRSTEIVAGGASARESVNLDLTIQVIAEATTGTDISEAGITVAEINAGDVDEAQRDSITLSRMPDSGKMQVWVESDSATRWLAPDVSGYQMQAALNEVTDGAFIVSRREVGQSVIFDLMRSQVGTNTAVTVSNTFIGPFGVTMNLDGSKILDVCAAANFGRPSDAVLTFTRNGETQFSQRVRLDPILATHGQIL